MPAYRLVVVPDVVWPDGVISPGNLRQHALREIFLERRRLLWDSAKALAEVAALEKRMFTGTESACWDKLMAELNELDSRISVL